MRKLEGLRTSSLLIQPITSPVALANPLFSPEAMPPSGSLTQNARCLEYRRMISTLPSSEPPSITMYSRFG